MLSYLLAHSTPPHSTAKSTALFCRYARDVQAIDVSGLAADTYFVLRFKDSLGRYTNTFPLPRDAAAGQVQAALESLPNGVLPSVTVSRGAGLDEIRVTFDDAATLGEQNLLECNPPALKNLCNSGYVSCALLCACPNRNVNC